MSPSIVSENSGQPLVSVVTPVYNGYAYLAESIESVLSQSYQNWELIILNNNSSDGSLTLANSYAAKDARIKVHSNTETLPQMENWNKSMSLIGDDSVYCKVVHADDWLFPNCLQEMVALAVANPSVALLGSYRLEEEAVTLDGLVYPSNCVSGRDIIRRRFLGSPDLFGSPTSVMYRSDQVLSRPEFYNELNLHADTEICFRILLDNDFGFVHQVLTFTRRHNETTSTYAKKMQTYKACDLMMLRSIGAEVLSQVELQTAISTKLKNYYRFLGFRLLQFRKPTTRGFWDEFWEYHKESLNSQGGGFSWLRVVAGSGYSVYKSILDKISFD